MQAAAVDSIYKSDSRYAEINAIGSQQVATGTSESLSQQVVMFTCRGTGTRAVEVVGHNNSRRTIIKKLQSAWSTIPRPLWMLLQLQYECAK